MPSRLLATPWLLQKLLSLESPWPQQPPAQWPRAPQVLPVPKGLVPPPIPPREEKKKINTGEKNTKKFIANYYNNLLKQTACE